MPGQRARRWPASGHASRFFLNLPSSCRCCLQQQTPPTPSNKPSTLQCYTCSARPAVLGLISGMTEDNPPHRSFSSGWPACSLVRETGPVQEHTDTHPHTHTLTHSDSHTHTHTHQVLPGAGKDAGGSIINIYALNNIVLKYMKLQLRKLPGETYD